MSEEEQRKKLEALAAALPGEVVSRDEAFPRRRRSARSIAMHRAALEEARAEREAHKEAETPDKPKFKVTRSPFAPKMGGVASRPAHAEAQAPASKPTPKPAKEAPAAAPTPTPQPVKAPEPEVLKPAAKVKAEPEAAPRPAAKASELPPATPTAPKPATKAPMPADEPIVPLVEDEIAKPKPKPMAKPAASKPVPITTPKPAAVQPVAAREKQPAKPVAQPVATTPEDEVVSVPMVIIDGIAACAALVAATLIFAGL